MSLLSCTQATILLIEIIELLDAKMWMVNLGVYVFSNNKPIKMMANSAVQ